MDKKYFSRLPSGPSWSCILFVAIFCFLLNACSLIKDAEVAGSFEAAYQEYCGGPYSVPSCTEHDLGYNIFMLLMMDKDDFYDISSASDGAGSSGSLGGLQVTGEGFSFPDSSPNFTDKLHLLTGLGIVNKRSVDGDSKVGLLYLEIPLCPVFETEIKYGKILGGLGPYLAYGIAGNIKSKSTGDKESSFDADNGFRRFDAGLLFTIGYKFDNDLRLRLGYERGIANLLRGGGDIKVHNRAFSVNVSYPWNKLMKK